ncbi:DedA family protein [Cellulomonas sp. P5_C6]
MTHVRDAYGLGGVSLGIAVVVLFAIVLARSHATYWAGRGVVRGAQAVHETEAAPGWWHATMLRLEAWTDTRTAQRGLDLVRRWGAVAVTLAYVTVGLQTAIFASAGLIKMPYLRFSLASIPGALVWAVVWATVGFGAVWGALALFAQSPWALLGVAVLLVGAIVWFVRRRLLRRARLAQTQEPAQAEV